MALAAMMTSEVRLRRMQYWPDIIAKTGLW